MTEPRAGLSDRPIPPVTAGPITEDHTPVLLWVHSGTATVTAAGIAYHLSRKQAIWIPPGIMHCTRTDENSVVLPIFPKVPELQGMLAEVRVIQIPRGWEDWLVFQFDFNRYHGLDAGPGASALLALVTDSPPRGEVNSNGAGAPPLPMPYSPEGRAVAQSLLRSPGSPGQTADFAARENVSVRTLQRQFRNETGIVFSEWRTRVRVTVAASHLADGRDIGWTGRDVGYMTPAGFTRGFRRYFGVTPREYVRRTGTLDNGTTDCASEPTAQLVADEPRDPPPIPSRQVWDWVYDWHVLWWTYRGTAEVRIGSHTFSMQRGQAIWLPAGISASVELAEGSILLPLGNRYGGMPIKVDELRTFSLPEKAEALLLHTVLAEYTLFASDTGPARLADELFREQFVSGRDSEAKDGLTGAVSTIARALRRDPADSRSLADWATHLRLSSHKVSKEFLAQTGSSFPHWRAHLRMSLAREMLMFGDPPNDVSRILGYATPAAFGKVFTTAHGISPRRYQREVSRERA